MTNFVAPSAVIFINNDLSAEVLSVIKQQFSISESITGEQLHERLAVDPNYLSEVKSNNLRLLVIKDFWDKSDFDLADIVLFAKAGLLSVEKSKYLSPGITYPIRNSYLSQLFFTKILDNNTRTDYCHPFGCHCPVCEPGNILF